MKKLSYFVSFLSLALSLPLLGACSEATEAVGGPPELTGTSGEAAQWIGGWRYFDVKFDCEASKISNAVKFQSRRHVYHFDGKAGQDVSFSLDGAWPKWLGAVLFVADAYGNVLDWDLRKDGAHAEISLTLPTSGRYWIFLAPYYDQYVTNTYAYTLGATCATTCKLDSDCKTDERCLTPVCITTPCDFPGTCVAQPLCAEYTTSDGRYYAKNFPAGSWDAANQWVTLDPMVFMSGVSVGTCISLTDKECPATDPPVCGTPISTDVTSTYASLCEFQKVVRVAAGSEGESKGKFTDGACAGAYCATATIGPPDTNSPTFYAKNFADKTEAANWLTQNFPNATKSNVFEQACDAPKACILIYAPVCGVVKSGPPNTYSNSCHFETAVMSDAGSMSESKGYYTTGACQ